MADTFDLTNYVKLTSQEQLGLIGKAAPAKVLSTILGGIRQDYLREETDVNQNKGVVTVTTPRATSTEMGNYKKAVKSDHAAIKVSIWNDCLANDRKEGVTQEVWEKSLDVIKTQLMLP
eukprot:12989358-Ditylum_brightwellii.AAC.1